MKKVLSFVLTSFIIGNVVAWFMGSAPIDFPKQAYNKEAQMTLAALKQALKSEPQDLDILIELGSQYSLHNDIDLAAGYLEQAITLDPKDALASAWYNANRAKEAGAMLDLSMGIYKLYKLNDALKGISQAVTNTPNDLTIRLVRLATFANIGQINPLFEQVFDDEKWFSNLVEKQGDQLPSEVKSQFYLSMAQAYLFEEDSKKVQTYLELYQTIPEKKASELEQFSQLEADFISIQDADRGAA